MRSECRRLLAPYGRVFNSHRWGFMVIFWNLAGVPFVRGPAPTFRFWLTILLDLCLLGGLHGVP